MGLVPACGAPGCTGRRSGRVWRAVVARAWLGAALLALGGCAGMSTAVETEPPLPSRPVWSMPAQGRPGLDYALFAPLPRSRVHVLRIALDRPGLQLRLSGPEQRGQVLSGLAASWRDEGRVLAAVNASFFDRDFVPRGLTVSQGRPWQPVLAPRSSPLLACDAQQRCAVQLVPPFAVRPEWTLVVAGTPWLVDAGRARDADDDARCAAFCAARHPRTALGLDAAARQLFIVLAEGRHPEAAGLSLAELALVLRELGAWQAFNLDGGGSSMLMLGGELLSRRPANEPAQRALANALLVVGAD